MEIAEVVDRESLEAYLNGLPIESGLRSAHYFALQMGARIAPVSLSFFSRQNPFKLVDESPLPIFGAISTAFTVFWSDLEPISAYPASLAALELKSSAPIGVAASTSVVSLAAATANATKSHPAQITFETCSLSFARVGEFTYSTALRGEMRDDSIFLETGQQRPLWMSSEMPQQIADDWSATCEHLTADKNDWRFWIAFYERLLAGKDIHANLLAPILSKLTKEDWLGDPALVTPLFNDVLKVYDEEDAAAAATTVNISKGDPQSIERTKTAMIESRGALPATLDAIMGYIDLEIERLQGLNYQNDAMMDEAKRQIRVLTTLRMAIGQLMPLIPTTEFMSDKDAAEAEGLVRLYVSKFQEWPRANAGDLVDNTIRLSLIGLTATVAPMVGISASVAAIGGAALFGSKKIAESAKAAKDAVGGGS